MLKLTNLIGFGKGGGSVNAVKFVANRDQRYIWNFSGPSAVDSPLGSISMWVRMDAFDGNIKYMLHADKVQIYWDNNSFFGFTVYDNGDPVVRSFQMTANNAGRDSFLVGSGWHYLAMSWNTNFPAGSKVGVICLDGSNVSYGVGTGGTKRDNDSAFSVAYTSGGVGTSITTPGDQASIPTTNDPDGGFAEVWYAPGQFIDFTSSANVQKFRSSSGRPAYLGQHGELPTGTAPAVYLRNPAATCGVNSGTGGNLTVVGTPTITNPP